MRRAYTADELAMLERQVAHHASADHVRSEVAVWRDATPTERLEGRVVPIAREPLPDESVRVLEALRALPR